MQRGKDLEMLGLLAELRLATAAQLARRLGVSERVVRRQAGRFAEAELVESFPRGREQGRGRPECVYSVSTAGAAALREAGVLSSAVPAERVTADALSRMVEHQLVLNWVAIQCRELDEAGTGFQARFISSTSPFHLSAAGRTVLADRVEFADGAELGFVPDAAISIGHAALERSLLFFLEVDTGTETVTDPKGRHDQDLWGKVVVYRTHFIRKGYRRYESDGLFGSPFRGFRLLMVCASSQRTRAVCHMVVQNQPSDFVWVAAAPDLLQKGLGAHVWRRGGNLKGPGSSILGRLAPRSDPEDGHHAELEGPRVDDRQSSPDVPEADRPQGGELAVRARHGGVRPDVPSRSRRVHRRAR